MDVIVRCSKTFSPIVYGVWSRENIVPERKPLNSLQGLRYKSQHFVHIINGHMSYSDLIPTLLCVLRSTSFTLSVNDAVYLNLINKQLTFFKHKMHHPTYAKLNKNSKIPLDCLNTT